MEIAIVSMTFKNKVDCLLLSCDQTVNLCVRQFLLIGMVPIAKQARHVLALDLRVLRSM